ncbi:MAG: hypothetical protein HY815_02650, partial [Candidatus Riflebacteria bacterium]|nr:hypothetical protein [Candidatus Riflebacteria bacterium]
MGKDPDDLLSAPRETLLSGAADETSKLAALKRLIERRADPRCRDVLVAAAAAPDNVKLLHVIVRSLGYLDDSRAMDDLAAFAQHPDAAVSSNALKAAASRDPVRAVQMGLPALRGSSARAAQAAAIVLAERCRAEADRVFGELARSADAADRVAALTYVRAWPREARVARMRELLETEPDPDVRSLVARLLAESCPAPRQEPPADEPPRPVASRQPGPTEAQAGPPPGSAAERATRSSPEGEPEGGLGGRMSAAKGPPCQAMPPGSAAERATRSSRRRDTARLQAVVPAADLRRPPPPAASPRQLGVVLLAVLLVYGLYWLTGAVSSGPATGGEPQQAAGLGRVGETVTIEGTIRGVHPSQEIL